MTPAAKAKPVLLGCPFCGGSPEITGRTFTAIFCANDQCISNGGYNNYGHREDAIDAWNTRVHTPTPEAKRGE